MDFKGLDLQPRQLSKLDSDVTAATGLSRVAVSVK